MLSQLTTITGTERDKRYRIYATLLSRGKGKGTLSCKRTQKYTNPQINIIKVTLIMSEINRNTIFSCEDTCKMYIYVDTK